jgi:hypothetical protein
LEYAKPATEDSFLAQKSKSIGNNSIDLLNDHKMKKNRLTDEQRMNMLKLGVGCDNRTTEGEVLKKLRKMKFTDFGRSKVRV